MIQFKRTRDLEQVARILTHPRIYPWIADDFQPAPDNYMPLGGEAIVYLLAFDGEELLGLFVTHPINRLLWEVHIAFLPEGWGRARSAGKAFLSWLWEHTLAKKCVGFIPDCNRLAIRYARSCGMRQAGLLTGCYLRAGQLCDLIIFQRDRPTKET